MNNFSPLLEHIRKDTGLAPNSSDSSLEKVISLRNWVANFVPLSEKSLELNNRGISYHLATADILYECYRRGLGGSWCSGTAHFFKKLLKLFGFESLVYEYGIRGTYTHAVNIVALAHEEGVLFSLQDAYLNLHYLDAGSGRALEFAELLELVHGNELSRISIDSMRVDGRVFFSIRELPGGWTKGEPIRIKGQVKTYKTHDNALEVALRHKSMTEIQTIFGDTDNRSCFLKLMPFRISNDSFSDLNLQSEYLGSIGSRHFTTDQALHSLSDETLNDFKLYLSRSKIQSDNFESLVAKIHNTLLNTNFADNIFYSLPLSKAEKQFMMHIIAQQENEGNKIYVRFLMYVLRKLMIGSEKIADNVRASNKLHVTNPE